MMSGEDMKVLKNIVTTMMLSAFFIYMGYILVNQQVRLNQLNNEITYFDREIQEANLETEKLNDTLASISDDEYMEEVARERLGLVMPSEMIFMDASI